MNSDAKNPFGLHSVTPYLIVKDSREYIGFLRDVFGAQIREGIRLDAQGNVRHAEVTIGDSVIMMGDANEDFPVSRSTLYMYVDDSDATYAKAVELECDAFLEPTLMGHGDRCGGFTDNEGNTWWVCTHVGKDGESAESDSEEE